MLTSRAGAAPVRAASCRRSAPSTPAFPLRATSALARRRARAGHRQAGEEARRLVRAEVALHVDADEVPAVLEDDELRRAAPDPPREPPRPGDGHRVIVRARDDERGRRDPRQLPIHVLAERAQLRDGRERDAVERRLPVARAHLGIAHVRAGFLGDDDARERREPAELRPDPAMELQLERGGEEHEAVDALGVIVGERAGDERAHRAADDEGAPRALEARQIAARLRDPLRPGHAERDRAPRRRAPP